MSPFAQIDAAVGVDRHNRVSDRENRAERVTRKLEVVMADPDLNTVLGSYMSQLILPGSVTMKDLTQDQADRVLNISRSTLRAMRSL